MKYSTAFVALVGSIVLTPGVCTLTNHTTVLKPQAITKMKTVVSEPPACGSIVKAYYMANDAQDSSRDVIDKCISSSVAKHNAALRLPEPSLLTVSLPPVAPGAVKREQLPSLDTINRAAAAMEENILSMSEYRTNFIRMDLPSKVDFLFCSIQGTGALCDRSGRFFPASLVLRTTAGVILRLFSRDVQLDDAVKALDNVNVQKAELVEGMSKMLKSLIANYPTTEQNTQDIAKWLKSYRLVQANINVVSRAIDLSMVEKLPKSAVSAGFAT